MENWQEDEILKEDVEGIGEEMEMKEDKERELARLAKVEQDMIQQKKYLENAKISMELEKKKADSKEGGPSARRNRQERWMRIRLTAPSQPRLSARRQASSWADTT